MRLNSTLPKLLFLILLLPAAQAQVPDAPIINELYAGACMPKDELCGDGVDQNCSGDDLLCPKADGDNDGYTLENDCNDTKRLIYPGVRSSCEAGCGTGHRLCQADGTYTACSCEALCEATGSGLCYYVSAAKGQDSNPGTYQAPWKTLSNFITYQNSSDRPSRHKTLSAGDVVYLLGGSYQNTFSYYGEQKTLYLRGIDGSSEAPVLIKAYPGHTPVISPEERATGVELYQCSHIRLEGLQIREAFGAGVLVLESSNIDIANTWIHHTDGVDNDNAAGVNLSNSDNLRLHHSLVHDNFDRSNSDTGGVKTENSRNAVIFGGSNIRVDHSIFYQSPPTSADKTGACLIYKHGSAVENSTFEVDYNYFRNCWQAAVGSGTSGTRIHHNLIIDSGPIEIKDFGGFTNNSDTIIEFNTFVRGAASAAAAALFYMPTSQYRNIGLTTFRRNIVYDKTANNWERGIITIAPYGSESLYNSALSGSILSIDNNCYFQSASSAAWSFFAPNRETAQAPLGLYGFSSWQTLGFDNSSAVVNPQFNSTFSSGENSCHGKGWLAD